MQFDQNALLSKVQQMGIDRFKETGFTHYFVYNAPQNPQVQGSEYIWSWMKPRVSRLGVPGRTQKQLYKDVQATFDELQKSYPFKKMDHTLQSFAKGSKHHS